MQDGLSDITTRKAALSDIPEILRQRRRMYEDMRFNDASALTEMMKLSADYLAKAILDGSFHAWLACIDDKPIAGGAVIVSPWLAHPYDLECRRATILNVYTDPEYRRRGIAHHPVVELLRSKHIAAGPLEGQAAQSAGD